LGFFFSQSFGLLGLFVCTLSDKFLNLSLDESDETTNYENHKQNRNKFVSVKPLLG